MTEQDRERWACWFTECSQQADDLTEGEKDGLAVAAAHLRNTDIAGWVQSIRLPGEPA